MREPRVLSWLSANSEDLLLSAIVLGELRFFVANQPEGKKKQLADALLKSIDAGVGSRFADFDERDALAYGNLMASMRRAGTPLPAIDGLIAAQALARGHAVATRNIKDFARTGLRVIDPWQA